MKPTKTKKMFKIKLRITPEQMRFRTLSVVRWDLKIYKVTGLKGEGFVYEEQEIQIDQDAHTECYCNTTRGIFLLHASDNRTVAFLLPETVRVPIHTARELLQNQELPPPRHLKREVINALNQALAEGESWQSASSRLAIGAAGNGSCIREITIFD